MSMFVKYSQPIIITEKKRQGETRPAYTFWVYFMIMTVHYPVIITICVFMNGICASKKRLSPDVTGDIVYF